MLGVIQLLIYMALIHFIIESKQDISQVNQKDLRKHYMMSVLSCFLILIPIWTFFKSLFSIIDKVKFNGLDVFSSVMLISAPLIMVILIWLLITLIRRAILKTQYLKKMKNEQA